MASGTKRKNSGRGGNRKQPAGRKQNTAQNRGYSNRRINEEDVLDDSVKDEICLIVLLAVCVLLFLCNFGIGGTVGSFFSGLMFGCIYLAERKARLPIISQYAQHCKT